MSRTYISALLSPRTVHSIPSAFRPFSSTPSQQATFNQVLRGCRVEQRARKARSPALVNRPQMKGVCLRVGVVKPKKPNSGERKVARLRLSSGKLVTAYIPGEGRRTTVRRYCRADTTDRAQRAAALCGFGERRTRTGLPWCEISSCQRRIGFGKAFFTFCN